MVALRLAHNIGLRELIDRRSQLLNIEGRHAAILPERMFVYNEKLNKSSSDYDAGGRGAGRSGGCRLRALGRRRRAVAVLVLLPAPAVAPLVAPLLRGRHRRCRGRVRREFFEGLPHRVFDGLVESLPDLFHDRLTLTSTGAGAGCFSVAVYEARYCMRFTKKLSAANNTWICIHGGCFATTLASSGATLATASAV